MDIPSLIARLQRHPNWRIEITPRGNLAIEIRDRHDRPLFDRSFFAPPSSSANAEMLKANLRRQAAYRLLELRRARLAA